MPPPSLTQRPQPRRPMFQRRLGLAVAFYAFIAIGLVEASLGVLLPSILETFQLTPATVTLLFLSQVSGYMVAALASSLIHHYLGLGRMVLLAAGLLTSTLAIYATTPIWGWMVAAGTLLGLGIGLIDAGINTYMVQDDRRANLLGALHGFYGIGALIGPAIATTLLTLGLPWRQVYGVLAGLVSALAMLVLLALALRSPGLGRSPTMAQTSALQSLGQALRSPVVLLTGLLLGLYVGVEAAITHWAFMVETVARQTPDWVAGYGISLYWLGLTVGRFGLGLVLPWVGAARLITLSLGLTVVGLLAWAQGIHPWMSLPLVGLTLAVIFPAVMGLIPQRIAPHQVPAAVGFASSSASFGAALIPAGVGWIAADWGLGIVPWLMLPLALAMLMLHLGLGRLPRHPSAI